MIAVAIGIAWHLGSGPAALAEMQPIRVVPQDVEITVFNETETQGDPLFMPMLQPSSTSPEWHGPTVRSGMALVKDHRMVMNLRKGDNVVRFTDVAAAIDPTSVRFVSDTDPLGTTVVEQNFEYDLATAAALLKRYVDKQVSCVTKDGDQVEGYLCSHDDASLVLADAPAKPEGGERKTQTVSREAVRAIQLPDVPKDLHTRPTLVWKIRTQREGQHDTTLSYACGQVKWQADYIAVVKPGGERGKDRIDLQGWVTIDNRSGAAYRDAGIKLIAGDVNRVTDPWWVPPVDRWASRGRRPARATGGDDDRFYAEEAIKAFAEKSFFEYHLYTLSAPSTVNDRQIKQLKLLRADGIEAKRWCVRQGADDAPVVVVLEFKNEQANQMGMPLPKGSVRLVQIDDDGDSQLIGQHGIDHTPKDEEMKLPLGRASDATGERSVIKRSKPGPNHMIETVRLRMRNDKDQPINGRFVETLQSAGVPGPANWTITKTTDEWTHKNAQTIHFDFVLDASKEKTVTYTVDYTW